MNIKNTNKFEFYAHFTRAVVVGYQSIIILSQNCIIVFCDILITEYDAVSNKITIPVVDNNLRPS